MARIMGASIEYARKLIALQLELECKGVKADNTLVRIPCAEPDDIPRFLAVKHDGGYTTYFRHDLAALIRGQLAALPVEHAFTDYEAVQAILAHDAPCEYMWRGVSYVFPMTLTQALYPDAVRLNDERHRHLLDQYQHWRTVAGKTVYGIIVEGRIVASCGSARENGKSAEAWVITEPEFRRRGYARQVTAAWAHDVHQQGKVPFYSHTVDNHASQAVAQSLGLIQFLAAAAYS